MPDRRRLRQPALRLRRRSCARRSSGSPRSAGYLLYLRQEGRGIGLYAKLDAYVLQDVGLDTYEANVALGFAEDARDYTVGGADARGAGPVPRRAADEQPRQGRASWSGWG